jgi:hypothetical protein
VTQPELPSDGTFSSARLHSTLHAMAEAGARQLVA